MHQNKTHTVAFEPAHSVEQRLELVKQALIEQGIPSGHELFLQAPGYPDLPIGRWGNEQCGPADLNMATSVKITW